MSVFGKRSAAIERAAREIGGLSAQRCHLCGGAFEPTHRLKETRRGAVHAACAEARGILSLGAIKKRYGTTVKAAASPRATPSPGALRQITWTTEPYERGIPEMGRFHLATYGHLSASIRERPGAKVAWWSVTARGPGQKFGQAQHLQAVASHTAPNVAAAKREVRRVFDGDFPAEWRDIGA